MLNLNGHGPLVQRRSEVAHGTHDRVKVNAAKWPGDWCGIKTTTAGRVGHGDMVASTLCGCEGTEAEHALVNKSARRERCNGSVLPSLPMPLMLP